MRTTPLTGICRSFDGQRWEALSHADARALFGELHAWTHEFIDQMLGEGAALTLCGVEILGPWQADDLFAAIIARIEAGAVVCLPLADGVELYLVAEHLAALPSLTPQANVFTRDQELADRGAGWPPVRTR